MLIYKFHQGWIKSMFLNHYFTNRKSVLATLRFAGLSGPAKTRGFLQTNTFFSDQPAFEKGKEKNRLSGYTKKGIKL